MNQTSEQAQSERCAPLSENDVRCEKVLRAAERLFARRPDWVVFFRKILGTSGLVRREFPSPRELRQFEQTRAYARIQQLLRRLREDRPALPHKEEPTRVITVRLPQSLHEALRVEAHQHCTSMNKLCISKLLQFIENDLVPNERFRLGRAQAAIGPQGPAEKQIKQE
jgi:predicted HicB family RNase H-like nuclease